MSYDLTIPPELDGRASKAAEIIAIHARSLGITEGGDSRMFYSKREWIERGERYGRNADLIVVHADGWMLSAFARAKAELRKEGFYFEEAETWYSTVYNQPL